MKKDDFLAKWRQIESEIRTLEKQLDALRNEYIESNKPFKVGTKVRIYCPADEHDPFLKEINEVGIVRSYGINADCDVVPNLAKVKKDGTPYQNGEILYPFWRHPIIEVCD